MIKILLDQNIPALIEPWLQNLVGDAADITSTRTLGMQRMSDQEIFYFCQQHQMVIITYDEDFQNPLVISDIPGYGVVRLNIYPTGLHQTNKPCSVCSPVIRSRPGRKLQLLLILIKFATRKNYKSIISLSLDSNI